MTNTSREGARVQQKFHGKFNVTFTPAVGECPTADSGSNYRLEANDDI